VSSHVGSSIVIFARNDSQNASLGDSRKHDRHAYQNNSFVSHSIVHKPNTIVMAKRQIMHSQMTEKMTMDKWDVGGLPHQNEYKYYRNVAADAPCLWPSCQFENAQHRNPPATNDERDDTGMMGKTTRKQK
jgi:hypothetical protein